MTEKVFNLVKAVITGVAGIAVGIVTYCCDSALAATINGAITIAVPTIIEICKKFIKK